MADKLFLEIRQEFQNKNRANVQRLGLCFLDIFVDLEWILKSSPDFLLGKWIESAKSLGSNWKERRLFEINSKLQISLWGPNGEIVDYANKQWSGVVSDLFYKRWGLFLYEMELSLLLDIPFNEKKVREDIFISVEQPFVFSNKTFTIKPEGDSLEISRALYQKWKSLINYQVIPLVTLPSPNHGIIGYQDQSREITVVF